MFQSCNFFNFDFETKYNQRRFFRGADCKNWSIPYTLKAVRRKTKNIIVKTIHFSLPLRI